MRWSFSNCRRTFAEIVKPVTKKSYCVKETEQLPWVFREAFRIVQEGRPGSALIDLPLDVTCPPKRIMGRISVSTVR